MIKYLKWTQILIDPVTFGWVVSSALGMGNIQLPVVAGVTGSETVKPLRLPGLLCRMRVKSGGRVLINYKSVCALL